MASREPLPGAAPPMRHICLTSGGCDPRQVRIHLPGDIRDYRGAEGPLRGAVRRAPGKNAKKAGGPRFRAAYLRCSSSGRPARRPSKPFGFLKLRSCGGALLEDIEDLVAAGGDETVALRFLLDERKHRWGHVFSRVEPKESLKIGLDSMEEDRV